MATTEFNPIQGITNKGFTGQEHIDELDLIDYNARIYDPNLGMMLQADTVIPDGPVVDSLNRYAYVLNNPLSYTDPTGHMPYELGFWSLDEISAWFGVDKNKIPRDAIEDEKDDKDEAKESADNSTNTANTANTAGTLSGGYNPGDLAFGVNTGRKAWNGSKKRFNSRKTHEGWNITPYGVFDAKGRQKSLSDVVDFPDVEITGADLWSAANFLFNPFQDLSEC